MLRYRKIEYLIMDKQECLISKYQNWECDNLELYIVAVKFSLNINNLVIVNNNGEIDIFVLLNAKYSKLNKINFPAFCSLTDDKSIINFIPDFTAAVYNM